MGQRNGNTAGVPEGPRSRYLASSEQFPRAAKVKGSTVNLFVDERLAGADMYGGICTVAPGEELPLHWHPIGELQFFLAGEGLLLDADGNETPIAKGGSVFSPRGPGGAHGFRNTGLEPLQILFVYPSAGGAPPELYWVDPAVAAALNPMRKGPSDIPE
jgi:oxalate decarboxylase/phosphoglucose isomerase-like protein (cupin superfamily)